MFIAITDHCHLVQKLMSVWYLRFINILWCSTHLYLFWLYLMCYDETVATLLSETPLLRQCQCASSLFARNVSLLGEWMNRFIPWWCYHTHKRAHVGEMSCQVAVIIDNAWCLVNGLLVFQHTHIHLPTHVLIFTHYDHAHMWQEYYHCPMPHTLPRFHVHLKYLLPHMKVTVSHHRRHVVIHSLCGRTRRRRGSCHWDFN